MPAAAPFLADRGVLRTAHGHASLVTGDTDVAADAFANLVDAAIADLRRQERIGDRGPRRADEIEHAAADLRDHRIRRGEAADADHRFIGQLFDKGGIRLLVALHRFKTRGGAVIGPTGDVDVPEVGQLGQHLDHLAAFAAGFHASGA